MLAGRKAFLAILASRPAPGCRGHCYRKALDLARREAPGDVVLLEEQWGDWLMSQHQVGLATELSCGTSGKQPPLFGTCCWQEGTIGLVCCLSDASEGMQCWLHAFCMS